MHAILHAIFKIAKKYIRLKNLRKEIGKIQPDPGIGRDDISGHLWQQHYIAGY
jgi:hypothetical protein